MRASSPSAESSSPPGAILPFLLPGPTAPPSIPRLILLTARERSPARSSARKTGTALHFSSIFSLCSLRPNKSSPSPWHGCRLLIACATCTSALTALVFELSPACLCLFAFLPGHFAPYSFTVALQFLHTARLDIPQVRLLIEKIKRGLNHGKNTGCRG